MSRTRRMRIGVVDEKKVEVMPTNCESSLSETTLV